MPWTDASRHYYFENNTAFRGQYCRQQTLNLIGHDVQSPRMTYARLIAKRLAELMPSGAHDSPDHAYKPQPTIVVSRFNRSDGQMDGDCRVAVFWFNDRYSIALRLKKNVGAVAFNSLRMADTLAQIPGLADLPWTAFPKPRNDHLYVQLPELPPGIEDIGGWEGHPLANGQPLAMAMQSIDVAFFTNVGHPEWYTEFLNARGIEDANWPIVPKHFDAEGGNGGGGGIEDGDPGGPPNDDGSVAVPVAQAQQQPQPLSGPVDLEKGNTMRTRNIPVGGLEFTIETYDDGDEKLFLRGTSVGEYEAQNHRTRSLPDGEWNPGNCLESLTRMDRFYVYGLVNPKNESEGPFYIGKGMGNRANAHGAEATNNPLENRKQDKIRELVADGCNFADIPRTIAHRLQENVALAIESCLLTSVYPVGHLTNIQPGHHAERFRKFGNWDYILGFDLPTDNNGRFGGGSFLPAADPQNMRCHHYVYVLLDPTDKKIFYVGKGRDTRLQDHFNDANVEANDENPGRKLDTIRALTALGKVPKDIGRIVAWVERDDMAIWIENLWMKFIVGFKNLTNDQDGKHSIHIRTHGDWQKRHGLDVDGTDTQILCDHYMAEGLDKLLQEVIDRLLRNKPLQQVIGLLQDVTANFQPIGPVQELIDKLQLNSAILQFGTAKVSGPEFARFAPMNVLNGVARLKIHTRFRRTIQVSIDPRGHREEVEWTIEHFKKLGAYPLRRADNAFSAEVWENNGLARDADEAAARLLGLIVLARTTNRKAIPARYAYMLDELPPARFKIPSGGAQLEKINSDGSTAIVEGILEAYDVYDSKVQLLIPGEAGAKYGVMVKVLRGEEELARCICQGASSSELFRAALDCCRPKVEALGYQWPGYDGDSDTFIQGL